MRDNLTNSHAAEWGWNLGIFWTIALNEQHFQLCKSEQKKVLRCIIVLRHCDVLWFVNAFV
jgi:hypothetical protein